MNKKELIEAVAKDVGISKTLVRKVLDSAIAVATKSLEKAERVALPGFGTFSVSRKKATTGRKRKTGQEIKIPAKKAAKFKTGTKLTEALK